MKSVLTLVFLLLTGQMAPMPKNNPNGVWQSASGTQYRLQLSGTDLKVELIATPTAKFSAYEVNLKNSSDEVNTYAGSGFFVEKVTIHDKQTGTDVAKECKFDTKWQLVVVNDTHIIGATSYIVRDVDSCAEKERQDPPNNPAAASLELTKK